MMTTLPQPLDFPAVSRCLFDMLATCRPHGGRTEHAFISRYLLPYGVEADGFGNLWLKSGDAPILWSSHVDTCHRREGKQDIVIDDTGLIQLPDGSPSNCLGADCTAGVWLMTEMIEAGIPGLYVFHRGEERGGLGSRYVATTEPHRLKGIAAAVAFDRRGTQSVITHQRGERSCSDAFAASLAMSLALDHKLDPTGLFTDTANYVDLVGECTNLSVGYMDEHSKLETLDLPYLLRLREALLNVDLTGLVFDRHPGDLDPDVYDEYEQFELSGVGFGSRPRLYDLVRDYPNVVADFLEMNGVTVGELASFLAEDIPF